VARKLNTSLVFVGSNDHDFFENKVVLLGGVYTYYSPSTDTRFLSFQRLAKN
jgi:hypothetical protein